MRQVVFDLETTGFKFSEGHRIVEIGGIEMMNGAVTGRSFHTYIDPERDMPIEAYRVHGLSEEFLRGKPKFTDAVAGPGFCEFVGDAELIAHNGIGFDLPFLNAELKAAGLGALKNPIKDTLHLARRKFPGAPANLDALCARFGIDTTEREKDGHGALLDSKLLAAVYIELTGGAQAGLDFAPDDESAQALGSENGAPKNVARKRPSALPSRVTEEEKRAHAAFLDEMGDDCLWRNATAK